MRHGVAEGDGDPGLSPQGVALIRSEARGLAKLGLSFDLVLSSPLRRAHQTAILVAGSLEPPSRVEVTPILSPGFRAGQLPSLLAPHAEARALLLVGHAPDLGGVAGQLAGAATPLSLDRGGFCWLELDRWDDAADAAMGAAIHLLMPGGALAALGGS